MGLLLSGVILWSVMHFLPAGASGLRGAITGAIGEKPWKGLVALSLILAIALIVVGWRAIDPAQVYQPPGFAAPLKMPLMFISVILLGAANAKTNIKRFLRHPMLVGVMIWSLAHLLENGDDRALVLFGGIGLWAAVMIPFLNKRDGAYEKPAPRPLGDEVKLGAIGAIIFFILLGAHYGIANIAPS